MNDRSATIRTAGPPVAFGVRVRTFVRSCSCTPLVGLQPPHQLTVANVDGSHLPDAAAEQHVGESDGGRASIQAPLAGDLHVRKRVERTGQLVRAAGRRPVPVGDVVADEEVEEVSTPSGSAGTPIARQRCGHLGRWPRCVVRDEHRRGTLRLRPGPERVRYGRSVDRPGTPSRPGPETGRSTTG
jgi:hypothetical protein